MKNKDKSRELVKQGIHMHLKGLTLKEVDTYCTQQFNKLNFDIRDKAFVKNLIMVSIRNRGTIEFILNKYLARPLPKNKIIIKAILIMGIAQIIYLRTENYAAVNSSVNFFTGPLKKWRSLANAILRKITLKERKGGEFYEKKTNIPTWLYENWIKQYGDKKTEKIIKSIMIEPYIDLKIKKDFDLWKNKIKGLNIFNNTIRVNKIGDLINLAGYSEGAWWVQNIASQLPVMLFKNIKNKEVIDLCAAPGGKTAQLLNQGAKVKAIEVSKKKITLLFNNIKRLNLSDNLNIINKDIRNWEPINKTNYLLLDVPCSATGTVRKNPDVIWNKKQEDIIRLSIIQKELLEKAINMVKKDGIIIYCNCSMQKEEGEGVIDYILKGKKVILDPISDKEIPNYPKNIINNGLIRTFPYMFEKKGGMDGFFVARLIKV
jgi:16S rRNA (cytosine967-C5)-methyltransferase